MDGQCCKVAQEEDEQAQAQKASEENQTSEKKIIFIHIFFFACFVISFIQSLITLRGTNISENSLDRNVLMLYIIKNKKHIML